MVLPHPLKNRDGHDPWWDLLGEQAQAARRKAALRARVALAYALTADLVVIVAWIARVIATHGAGPHA